MEEITTIGVDIAKNVFQLHGVNAEGQVVLRKAPEARTDATILRGAFPLPDWHGSLRDSASLGANADSIWP